MKNLLQASALVAACSLAAPALGHDVRADDHAPIGVTADHTHKKGEIMFSLRYMHMEMSGNQIGTDRISNDQIVTSIPNRFAGMPMQPPTLRLVPQSMHKDMVMLGAMVSPADWITLVAMLPYGERKSTITTYAGPTGTTVLGEFQARPKGIGDISVGAIFPLLGHKPATTDTGAELNLRAAVGIPTGSIDETGQTLTPTGAQPTMVMAYGMQSGSGTWDLKPALTLKHWSGKWSFGGQYAGTIRTGTNDHGYRLGDVHEGSLWASYLPAQWISLSGRIRAQSTGRISGINPAVMGPVQTANPDFSGGERLDLIGGVNFVATHGSLAGHRLGIELAAPVYQNVNGPQLTGDWMLTVGWQKAF